jgi:hypothetical protein
MSGCLFRADAMLNDDEEEMKDDEDKEEEEEEEKTQYILPEWTDLPINQSAGSNLDVLFGDLGNQS